MHCPHCGKFSSRVRYTLKRDLGLQRRRVCLVCKGRYSTLELTVTDIKRLATGQAMLRSLANYMKQEGTALDVLDVIAGIKS